MSITQYEFVPGLDRKSYTGRIRAHVLRRYYQAKSPENLDRKVPFCDYLQSRHYRSIQTQESRSQVLFPTRSRKNVARLDSQHGDEEATLEQCSSAASNEGCEWSSEDALQSWISVPYSSVEKPPSSISTIFSTCQVSMSSRQRYLVHHFITWISSPLYELDSQAVRFNPPRDICFRRMMDEGVGMIALATAAAYDVARLSTGGVNAEAIELELDIIRLLNKRLSNVQTNVDDLSILLVIVFICADCEILLEARSEQTLRQARMHVDGLRRIISQRGGFSAFTANARVGWHLHWYDIVNAGDISAGISPFSYFLNHYLSNGLQTHHPKRSSKNLGTFADVAACELIGFCSAIHDLTNGKQSSILARIRERILTIFPPKSLLYAVFQSAQSESESNALSAVLVYLCAVVWDLCNCAQDDAIELYFVRLSTFMLQQGLFKTPSRHVLLWTLMTDMNSFITECPERCWLVSHCLWTMKRLGGTFANRVQEALREFLFEADNTEPHRGLSWKPEEMAQAVWQDLPPFPPQPILIDYHSPDAVQDIIKLLHNKSCAGALAIGHGSTEACLSIVTASKGRKFVAQVSAPVDIWNLPSDMFGILRTMIGVLWSTVTISIKTRIRCVGVKFHFGTDLMANEVGNAIYDDFLPMALAKGEFVAAPEPQVVDKGLDSIQEAMVINKKGVSAKKVVVTL